MLPQKVLQFYKQQHSKVLELLKQKQLKHQLLWKNLRLQLKQPSRPHQKSRLSQLPLKNQSLNQMPKNLTPLSKSEIVRSSSPFYFSQHHI